ncbi:MAG: hypothetical protein EBU62_00190 [Proteobacteria bacterium]|nr:hypothetical protein [Pseudomonadota bacterium]
MGRFGAWTYGRDATHGPSFHGSADGPQIRDAVLGRSSLAKAKGSAFNVVTPSDRDTTAYL